jgi:hypothetical protein
MFALRSEADVETVVAHVCYGQEPTSADDSNWKKVPGGACGSPYLRRASKALRTASVMASTPVVMVGFGTGANCGEWLDGNSGPVPLLAAATRSGS